MLRLILLRHSKAVRARAGERDHDRGLEPRGECDAERIGAYLAHHSLAPDLAIVSSAKRTLDTWKIAIGPLPPHASQIEERLYQADASDLFDLVRETPDAVRTLLVVGHNPGLHDFADMLIATGDVDLREKLKEEFPTSALAEIDIAVTDWSKVHPHGGRLVRFVSPRSLTAATE